MSTLTFRGRHGYDGKAPLIDGFEVVRDERVVGFIWPAGMFSNSYPEGGRIENPDIPLTEAEFLAIEEKCVRVRKMPSEYGWIGVGEPMDVLP